MRSTKKSSFARVVIRFFNMIDYTFRTIKNLRARTNRSKKFYSCKVAFLLIAANDYGIICLVVK